MNGSNSKTAARAQNISPVSIAEPEWGWDKAEANILPSPWQSRASGVTVGAGGRGKGEQAAWCLSNSSTEAPTWGRKQRSREVAPEEASYMTASLCSLLPWFIRVQDSPLHCSGGWKHHDQIQPLLANPFSLNKPVHNNWELEGDEIIIFFVGQTMPGSSFQNGGRTTNWSDPKWGVVL